MCVWLGLTAWPWFWLAERRTARLVSRCSWLWLRFRSSTAQVLFIFYTSTAHVPASHLLLFYSTTRHPVLVCWTDLRLATSDVLLQMYYLRRYCRHAHLRRRVITDRTVLCYVLWCDTVSHYCRTLCCDVRYADYM